MDELTMAYDEPRVLRRARAVVDALTVGAAVTSAVVICAIAGLTVADVARRNIQGPSIPGALEISETLLVVAVFLGLPYAEKTGAFVRTTIVTGRLKGRPLRVVQCIALSIMCVALAWIAWASVKNAVQSVREGEVRVGLVQVPIWPGRIVLALGYLLLLVRSLFDVYDTARGRPPSYARGDEESVVTDVNVL
jgi:TRAP-type C4-dicarboxylate transport system permease small subunit